VSLSLDWNAWRPIMQAYEARKAAYFATPPTNLILALSVGLGEILADGMEARFTLHERGARAMRAAWAAFGVLPLATRPDNIAHTLSALRYPAGVDASLVGKIADRGVYVAGGLHPAIRSEYFRVGHMGYALTRTDYLMRTVEAIGSALEASGHTVDAAAAAAAMLRELQAP
jgi:alanine-glyoxylate transaminase/serine-glyoxylate transaminase/serine-pyruvate transaminase